jgi:hypothetical protein
MRRSQRLALCLGLLQATALLSHAATLPPFLMGTNLTTACVVIIQDAEATYLFRPRQEKIRTMVSRAITNLTGKTTAAAAWGSLVSPQDIVGIKVFAAPGPTCGTRPAVVAAVIEGLLASGVKATNIVVWDKQLTDLVEAGFNELVRQYGVRLEGSIAAGYDEKVFYESSLLGSLIWGDLDFGKSSGVVGRSSYVSKLVTRQITKIINVSPLLNNNLTGVSGNLYSLAFGSVDNTIRFESDPEQMASAVPEIYALPMLGDRVILTITDALLCQYEGSQRGLLHYSTVLNQLRFSRDPVALDVLSIQELERQRSIAGAPALKPNLTLYQNASLLELGVSDTNKIQVEHLP